MKYILHLEIYLLFFLIPNYTYCQNSSLEIWKGNITEGLLKYTFIIQVDKQKGDSIFGKTISRNNQFYCETQFIGFKKYGKCRILETKILKLNYKGDEKPCLMDINTTFRNNLMQGSYTSRNEQKENCSSGIVNLRMENKIPQIIMKENNSKKNEIKSSIKEEKKITTIYPEKMKVKDVTPDSFSLENREIEILNTYKFDEDSVTIKIYDNGVIDGDVISLIVNRQVVFDKVKLTDRPLSYFLRAATRTQFQVEFYAETLGEIPPNTGLISISSVKKTSEILFSSDLKKSAAIKIVLNNTL